MLGAGAYGNVWLFINKKTEKKVAIKIMEKAMMIEHELEIIKDEIGILATFDHPNIVKHIESYEDPKYIYIIMGYMANSAEMENTIDRKRLTTQRGSPLF
jgi:serine/threonine protein kinase